MSLGPFLYIEACTFFVGLGDILFSCCPSVCKVLLSAWVSNKPCLTFLVFIILLVVNLCLHVFYVTCVIL